MSVINFVVPTLQRHVFTGGIYCIFEYASGLVARGHEVNLVPLLPSPEPLWFKRDYGRLLNRLPPEKRAEVQAPVSRRARATAIRAVRRVSARVGLRFARFFPHEVQRGFQIRYVRRLMPQADVTIATSFETALPVHLFGTGRRFYFTQHFEPYFAVDMPNPELAEHEATTSYRLGLNIIANSQWLKSKLRQEFGVTAAVCPNAIDHTIFHGEPKLDSNASELRVISYGGRDATWKGFREMAAAIRRVRELVPSINIRWLVYGDSLLPPKNSIADYEPLGFLQPEKLAAAYRSSDVLLSASWYESFPLFPLEAMACGLPVVTTQIGTEEYASHGRTAEIVQPRDPESIAQGLLKLIRNVEYRRMVARNGWQAARNFQWESSVDRMQALLLSSAESDERSSSPRQRIG